MALSLLRRTTTTLLFLMLLLVAAVGVTAQDSDRDRLQAALDQSAFADSFGFDFLLDASISGIPGDVPGQVNTITVTGNGSVTSGAADLVVTGTLVDSNGEMPVALWLRAVDGILYFSQDGEFWTGSPMEELAPVAEDLAMSNFRSGFAEGLDMGVDDPALEESLQALQNAVSALNPASFLSVERVEQGSSPQVDHYVSRFDIPGLMQSDEMLNLIANIVQVGDPSMAAMSQADLAVAGAMIGSIFTDTSIEMHNYVVLETGYIERTVIDIQLNVDPTIMGSVGDPLSVSFNFDIMLYDYENIGPISAPPGAMVLSNVAGVLGLDTPAQPVATLPPFQVGGPATATPVAGIPSGVISANTPVVVAFDGSASVDLVYAGTAGETITVTARTVDPARSLDTTVEVLSPDGTRLQFNDDHGTTRTDLGLFDSAITDLVLPTTGVYTIRAGTFSGGGIGSIEVTVQTAAAQGQLPTAVATLPPPVATGPLVANTPVTVRLDGSGPVELTYTAAAAETVTITARSLETPGTLDTTLEVLAPDGTTLDSNDDHNSGFSGLSLFDSAIRDLVLPSAGSYTIRVDSFMGSGRGSVEVAVLVDDEPVQPPTAVPTQPADGPAVLTGDQLTGNVPVAVSLRANAPTELTYTGAAGETVTVIARSLEAPGTLDTTVELLSPNGTRLSFNDDHGSSLPNLAPFDSAIRDLVLPSAGNYTVRVSTFSGAGEGSVEVTVLSDVAPAQPTAVPLNVTPTTVPVVQSGDTEIINGEIQPGGTFSYSFTGQANQLTTITVRAANTGNLDPKVALVGPTGATLAENDDHSDNDPSLGSLDSRIRNFALPSDGSYQVVVSGFANTAGAFELTIDRSGAAVPQATLVGPVSTPVMGDLVEQVISGRVRANETFTFELPATAGEVYSIAVRGDSGFDPRLLVVDPDGVVAAENDDHGTGDRTLSTFDSLIDNFIVQRTGTYTLEVVEYSGSPGSFELSITLVMTGAPLGPGTDSISLGEVAAGGVFTTTVDLNAGDFVSITIRAVSGDLDPMVALIAPSGDVVAENDDHSDFDSTLGRYDSRIPRMLVNETGTYTIEVTAYGGSGSFTVTVNTISSQ